MSRALKFLLAATLFTQVAMAQGDKPTPPPVPSEVTVPQKATLSPQDMLRQAQEYRANMSQVLQRLNSMVEKARKDRDVIKLNCLNDKLVQGKANLNVGEAALTSLQDAVSRNDDGASMYEYTRVTLVNQKIDVLGAEAEACIGEEIGYVGATRVDVDVDPDLRQDDPTQPGAVRIDVVARNPSASLFQ